MIRPTILHCDTCGVWRSHRTVEAVDYCDTCDTRHSAPFVFGELTPTQIGYCYLLHDEYRRGILTEYPPEMAR